MINSLKVANIMHWGLGADDEVAALFHFPALTRLEFHFWSAVNADKGITVDYFHDFFGAKVKTQGAR
jgi:hypothetical protein